MFVRKNLHISKKSRTFAPEIKKHTAKMKNEAQKFIAYYRVSTEKQAASGLGLAAQKTSVQNYVQRVDGEIVGEYSEAQSGKLENTANRKQFANAVAACKRKGAILLVAKLDRLARCCSVLEAIQSAGVAFRVAEMPEANELTLGLLMVIARNEREMCAARTKAALAEKKAQGVKLGAAREGAYKFTAATAAESRAKHTEKARENKANRHAWNFAAPFLGGKSLREIARLLNAEGYNTPRGGQWTAQQVSNLAKLMGA